jgi:hypothetical protein
MDPSGHESATNPNSSGAALLGFCRRSSGRGARHLSRESGGGKYKTRAAVGSRLALGGRTSKARFAWGDLELKQRPAANGTESGLNFLLRGDGPHLAASSATPRPVIMKGPRSWMHYETF